MLLLVFFCCVQLVLPALGIEAVFHHQKAVSNTNHHRNNRIKRIKYATLCNIEDFPCLATMTKVTNEKIIGNTTSMEYFIGYGVLITLEWLLTVQFQAKIIADEDGIKWKIFAGSNEQMPNSYDDTGKFVKSVLYGRESEPDQWTLMDKDQLGLLKFTPAFKADNTSKIQPAKLPPDAQFSSQCKKVIIAGWGSADRFGEDRDFDIQEVQKSQLLSKSPARVVKCKETLNFFCLELIHSNQTFCSQDRGLPVFCENNTLIGIIQKVYTSFFGDCGRKAYATNISHYMTWLSDTTGVEVSFQSEPIYEINVTTTTKTIKEDKYQPWRKPTKTSHTAKKRKDDEATSEIWNLGNDLKADFHYIFIGLLIVLLRTL